MLRKEHCELPKAKKYSCSSYSSRTTRTPCTTRTPETPGTTRTPEARVPNSGSLRTPRTPETRLEQHRLPQ